MNDARSEHIHTTASAISAGFPKRPMGWQLNNVFVNLWSAKEPLRHWRFDHCGTHCVDPDSTFSGFERGGFGETNHSMFARTIGRCPSRTHQPSNRRHVYDSSATALLEHLPNFVLQAKPDALEIDVDGPIQVFFGLS